MAKIKIIYAITKSNWGGAQRYVYDLATNIPKDIFEVSVVAGGEGALMQKLKSTSIPTIRVPGLERNISIFGEITTFIRLFYIFLKERPAIVHLNSSKIGGTGAIAARIAGIFSGIRPRIIFTAHGWAFEEERPPLQKKIILFLSRIASYVQDAIIIISKHDFDMALKYGIAEEKLSYIPLGISAIDFMSPREAEARLSSGIGKKLEPPIIGTIAELTKNKGLPHLIQALFLLKQKRVTFSCIIIGSGEDKEAIQTMIIKNGLRDSVFLAGFIDDASSYLRCFDIFVLPSLKEGLPYVLLEAMEAGLPLIGTSVGGIPDIIHDGKNGLIIPPKNPSRLSHVLEALISSKDMRRDFAIESKKRMDNFSFRAMLEKTLDLYAR